MLEPGLLVHARYRIVGPIGMGGFGAVYEAIDLRLNRSVALKQLLRPDERLSRQFTREAQLLASLNHPALPRVTDHFIDSAGPFLVMDYVEGDDLAAMLAQHDERFSVDRVLDWGDELLAVLQYLHGRQPPIIHRDIKPQNLKLREDGAIMLLDFGLAKGLANEMAAPTTQSILAYTKGYAPLEQVRGLGTDARSDLYSLGATLYALLTNTPPVEAELRAYAARHNVPDELASTLERTPQLPPAVVGVLLQALAIEPQDRPANAETMRKQLRAARSVPLDSVPTEHATGSVPTPVVAALPAYADASNMRQSPAPAIDGVSPRHAGREQPAGAAVPPARRMPPWYWLVGGAGIALVVALLLTLLIVLLRVTAPVDRASAQPQGSTLSVSEPKSAVAEATPVTQSPSAVAVASIAGVADPAPSISAPAASAPETVVAAATPTAVASPTAQPSLATAAPSSPDPSVAAPSAGQRPASEAADLTVLATAGASSVLAPENTACCGFVRYDAGNVLDGKSATSWVEGEAGPGIGTFLELAFAQPIAITRIGLNVGFDRDERIFDANNRLRRARFVWGDGSSQTVEFQDVRGVQYAELQTGATSSLRIYVEAIFPGSRYDDTSVAEVEVWGRVIP